MSNFKSKLVSDAKNVFADTDKFGEDIVFAPLTGTEKVVKAIVNRRRLDAVGQDGGRNASKQAEVFIPNDYETGVISVKRGADKIRMPVYNEHGSFEPWIVIEVLNKDEGMWHLLVQR